MSVRSRLRARSIALLKMGSALRYPQYRRFWLSNLAAVSGQQMMILTQGWLIYDLTGSPLYLGYAGLATAVPAIVLNLMGGVLADRLDQRRIIALGDCTTATLISIIATLTLLDLIEPWHVLVNAFVWGAVQAFLNPARQSIFPQLIDRTELMNAVSLNSMVWQSTRVVAPSVAGLIVAAFGTPFAFYVAASGFLTMALTVLTLKVERPTSERRTGMLRDLVQGVGFIRDNFIFTFLIGMTFFNSLFGAAAIQLMPVFARDVLDVGASGLGLLLSVSAVGSIAGVFIIGSLGNYQRKGLLVVGGATVYGLSLILFAASTLFVLSAVAIIFVGMFRQIYMVAVQTTLHMRVPDELRGRVMGVYGMTYNLGPLGALQAGAVAAAFSAPIAVAFGGVAIMAFALGVALSTREVRQLQATAPAAP